jgi:hypothetical protein
MIESSLKDILVEKRKIDVHKAKLDKILEKGGGTENADEAK